MVVFLYTPWLFKGVFTILMGNGLALDAELLAIISALETAQRYSWDH